MRVICIDDNWNPAQEHWYWPAPKFGDIDEVLDTMEVWGKEVYRLVRFGYGFGYITQNFATLSNISETEMIRNYKMQPA